MSLSVTDFANFMNRSRQKSFSVSTESPVCTKSIFVRWHVGTTCGVVQRDGVMAQAQKTTRFKLKGLLPWAPWVGGSLQRV